MKYTNRSVSWRYLEQQSCRFYLDGRDLHAGKTPRYLIYSEQVVCPTDVMLFLKSEKSEQVEYICNGDGISIKKTNNIKRK